MAEAVYLLCAVTSVVCALMLFRGYRAQRTRLLFWSSLCFSGLALNNILTFLDLVIVSSADFSLLRGSIALIAIVVLIYGLICELK
jgi:uncharacterized protein DUF5985